MSSGQEQIASFARPSLDRRAAQQKRHGDLLRIRKDSRDSLIEQRRQKREVRAEEVAAWKEKQEAEEKARQQKQEWDELEEQEYRVTLQDIHRIWRAYIDALGLPYTNQYSAVKDAHELLVLESVSYATDIVIQNLEPTELVHLVDVLIEVSTSTWEPREEYVLMTLEIILALTAPTEVDAIPLLANTRLVAFMKEALGHAEPPSPELMTLFCEVAGNMCTHPHAYDQVLQSGILAHFCDYIVSVECNDAALFALRAIAEPFEQITPVQMEPLATNLVQIFTRLSARSEPVEFGQSNALEMLDFVMQFNGQYIKSVFTVQLIEAVLHSMRGHGPATYQLAANLFANISFDGGKVGYDLVLASSEKFMRYVENRLMATHELPKERVLLFRILCNLVSATERFSIVTNNYTVKEVLVSSLNSDVGDPRVEAAFLWEYAIRQTHNSDDLELCIWPTGGIDPVTILREGLQLRNRLLNDDTIHTMSTILETCRLHPRLKSGQRSRTIVQRLFKDTNLEQTVSDYYFSCQGDTDMASNAKRLLERISREKRSWTSGYGRHVDEDEEDELDDPEINNYYDEYMREPYDDGRPTSPLDYETATHVDWSFAVPKQDHDSMDC